MNKIRIFNEEEIKKLLNNPNVEYIKNKSQIIYKNKFKLWAVKEKLNHIEKTAREIFIAGGFDMNILDERTPQKRLSLWVKKYKMFGEDYFNNDIYSYKAKLKQEKNNPDFIAFVIEKQKDGSLKSRIVEINEDE